MGVIEVVEDPGRAWCATTEAAALKCLCWGPRGVDHPVTECGRRPV